MYFALQVILSIVTILLRVPHVLLRMPMITEEYVEMLCDLPIESLVPPLAYNVLLMVCCSVYAFKARALPDNFNESRYIFVSVCTTLFLWLAFIPTYFSAFYSHQKALLLTLILLLNPSVMLLSLYVPKIYAIFYVDEEKMKLSNKMTMISRNPFTTNSWMESNSTSRVHPEPAADNAVIT